MLSIKKAAAALGLALCITLSLAATAYADSGEYTKTTVSREIAAAGVYENWDGVSNVAQFTDGKGRFCFAYDGENEVTVITMNEENRQLKRSVTLKKQYPIFGTVICDGSGNYYLVTGKENSTKDKSRSTVFISKYNSDGKLISTVGDNGSSSLAYHYNDSFRTKIPFDGGSCHAAINGRLLTVHYAREMYSGHQSNSVFTVDITDMTKVNIGEVYSSHSFAQRVISYKDGFVFVSEGYCYSRAFTVNTYTGSGMSEEKDIFHFWVEKNALANWNMTALNNNFAHMGGIAALDNGLVAFLGTSAKSLSSKAKEEKEGLFLQIFDPTADLNSRQGFVTDGTRSGLSGPNGDEKVTDYGVKWLLSANTKIIVKNPQIVSTGDSVVILFERYEPDANSCSGTEYKGVYYAVIGSDGKVLQKLKCFSKTAYLNPCVMPVYTGGSIWWAGNSADGKAPCVNSYRLTLD